MTAPAWVLLAAALVLLPGSRRRGRRARLATGRGARVVRSDGGRGGAVVATLAAGLACVALAGMPTGVIAAVVVGPIVWVVLQRLRDRATPASPDVELPLCLDLAAAALRAGRPLPDALSLAAPAAGPDTSARLARVAGLLRLGADPAASWAAVAGGAPLASVGAAAARSADSGIKLADAFERTAGELRADRAAAAAVRAHRAGIHALGPLAACFLPSFVCLGVVPVVVGVARTVLGTVGG